MFQHHSSFPSGRAFLLVVLVKKRWPAFHRDVGHRPVSVHCPVMAWKDLLWAWSPRELALFWSFSHSCRSGKWVLLQLLFPQLIYLIILEMPTLGICRNPRILESLFSYTLNSLLLEWWTHSRLLFSVMIITFKWFLAFPLNFNRIFCKVNHLIIQLIFNRKPFPARQEPMTGPVVKCQ